MISYLASCRSAWRPFWSSKLFVAILMGSLSAHRVWPAVPDVIVSNVGRPTESGIKGFSETGSFLGEFALTNSSVYGLTYGPDGYLYAALVQQNAIVRLHAETGAGISSFTSGGNLNFPSALVFGPDGHLYVADASAVKRFSGVTGVYLNDAIALSNISGLAFGVEGHLYVTRPNGVYAYDLSSGKLLRSVWPGVYGGLIFGPGGHLYVSDLTGNSVFRFKAPSFDAFEVFAEGGGLQHPLGLGFGRDGHLYVVSNGNNSVKRFDSNTGRYLSDFIPSGTGNLNEPRMILFRSTTSAAPNATRVWNVEMGRPFYWETTSTFSCSSTNDLFTFKVQGSGRIVDVDVRVSMRQQSVGELAAQLTSPAGTRVVLFLYPNAGADASQSGNHFQDTYLDDEAVDSMVNAVAPFAGPEYAGGKRYRLPVNQLSAFDGEESNGTWKLEIFDRVCSVNTGTRPLNALFKAGDPTGLAAWPIAVGTQLIITSAPETSAPRLSVTISPDRQWLTLSWPNSTAGYELEEATHLGAAWTRTIAATISTGEITSVQVSVSPPQKFFRLAKR